MVWYVKLHTLYVASFQDLFLGILGPKWGKIEVIEIVILCVGSQSALGIKFILYYPEKNKQGYPRCEGVQTKNGDVSQGTNWWIFWA